MELRKSKKIRFVLLGIALLLIVYISLTIKNYYTFSQTSITPSLNNFNRWTPYIKIEFNHNLSSKGLLVSSKPNILYGHKYYTNGNSLFILLSTPLTINETYKIDIVHLADINGQSINSELFSLKPTVSSINKLSDSLQEYLVIRNEGSSAYNNPILKHLPYFTGYFTLSPVFNSLPNGSIGLVLEAQISVPLAYTGSLEQQFISQQKQAVLDYISSIGLNPTNYTIKYSY